MKNVDSMEMSSSIHDSTIIVCKEATRKGKTGVNITVKANYNHGKSDDVEIHSLEDRRKPLSYEELSELLELARTNSGKYIEKLILTQFGDTPILGESVGTSYLLPNRFQRFYENCVSFYNEDYNVYFTDLAIERFARFIKELREKRKKDSIKYAEEMISSDKARHLSLHVSTGFDFNRTTDCVFQKNDDQYVRYFDPKNVLYYSTSQDKSGVLDQDDIKNMLKILTMFAEREKGISYIEWDNEEAVARTHRGGSIKLTGRDINNDIFETMHVLLKRK